MTAMRRLLTRRGGRRPATSIKAGSDPPVKNSVRRRAPGPGGLRGGAARRPGYTPRAWNSTPSSAPPPPEPADSDLFRRQESTLVGLNLAVLAALVLVHLGFSGILGAPNRPVLIASATFFLLQTLELFALQTRRASFGPRAIFLYPRVSVPVKLLLGVLVAWLGGAEDSHYSVLLMLPIMSAAFRFRMPAILLTAAAAGLLTMIDLRLYYAQHPPLMPREFYEAATVVLIYFVAGIVVGHLTGQLRHDRRRLRESLAELERTKDRLVQDEKLAAVGRLAGAIAHEIRNPVAMIMSSARMVRARGRPAAGAARCATSWWRKRVASSG